MSNEYYTPTGTPATGAAGSSAPVRAEFNEIEDGFDLMPALSGNGGKAVIINSGGTAMTVTTGTLALAGNFATTGAYNTSITQQASITLTLPAVSGTVATLAGTETLSNKTLVAPALGTPASGVLTNCTGTASGLTAGTVTTNANLTGPVTSTGNATSITQTGTGTTFVMDTSPTLVTPVIGAATGTSLSVSGQLTSTVATGTAPLVVSSTTVVSNLNVSSLLGSTWAAPGTIGSGTPSTGVFSTLADSVGSVRSIIQSGSDKTTGYVLAASDNGQFVGVGSGGSITIPDATLTAGMCVTIYNNTTGSVTITCSITTAYIAGTDSDKATMTLATRGLATILFISGTVCAVAGNVT